MPTTTTIRKLYNHPYANCRVVEHQVIGKETDKFIRTWVLFSYKTNVLSVSETSDGWFLNCYGLYSMTTRRHISWFLDEIGSPFTFQDAKHSAETGRISL